MRNPVYLNQSQGIDRIMERLLEGVAGICRQAGDAILEVYDRQDLGIQTKSDQSPLTAADLAAHQIIMRGLNELAPDIPVLSEESDQIPFELREKWSSYFLVDPLDGTKEFINRNGEFTVNIALIENHQPVLGVVFVPVQDVLYRGVVGTDKANASVEREGKKQTISTRQMDTRDLTVVASRRHGSETMEECMQALNKQFTVRTENVGSSLKFCMIAEGKADLYPRLAPTSEWDTAAAQAVVEAAGGSVVDSSFNSMRYNTKESILNPYFFALADRNFDWQSVLADVGK